MCPGTHGGLLMPGTRAVSKNIRELHEANKRKAPGKRREHDQIVAIAHEQSRDAGGKPRSRRKRGGKRT